MLTITGVKAGSTTITVTAFDGVNDGVPITIDVIVVDEQQRANSERYPRSQRSDQRRQGAGKLTSDSAKEVPFTAVITAGVSGEATEDDLLVPNCRR